MLTLKFACPSCMQTHEVQQWRISSETARCKSGETYYDFYCPKSGCNHHVGWFGPVDASNPFETLKPDNVLARQQPRQIDNAGVIRHLCAGVVCCLKALPAKSPVIIASLTQMTQHSAQIALPHRLVVCALHIAKILDSGGFGEDGFEGVDFDFDDGGGCDRFGICRFDREREPIDFRGLLFGFGVCLGVDG